MIGDGFEYYKVMGQANRRGARNAERNLATENAEIAKRRECYCALMKR